MLKPIPLIIIMLKNISAKFVAASDNIATEPDIYPITSFATPKMIFTNIPMVETKIISFVLSFFLIFALISFLMDILFFHFSLIKTSLP